MHGGREGEEDWRRRWRRHMRSVPIATTRIVVAAAAAGDSVADSFCKDGRNIRIGDCALFKPAQDSPPFIGIIRWLKFNRENNLQLGVNWLYRPAGVKLGRGILLEALPNEIFYSFHEDEIPAASLLHPCKVAFLPKGAELPPGVSSFACWRVYDIANKCLWWLTDQDYIDERQEEVNKLLYKTRKKMHAVQSGGRSPKPINVPLSTSQLKASDNAPNNYNSFPSQVKGKKRERGDQVSEPVKRERSSKIDDSDPYQFKLESILKMDIAKITENGGLVDSEGVEKLVQLMQPVERKMDLMSRSMLAGVIAFTEKVDCLSQFVQLKGLPVLDEWLQDINKGNVGDGTSPRDSDKSAEQFLLVLLRALDKLPVNLPALQMCNIGKSVNHLRTHKNWEIQKKARSLVDTWKKRVEAEMNIIDAKSGPTQAVSWPKSRLTEVSHGGNRQPDGSSEVAVKSSVMQSSAVNPSQSESHAKSSSLSPWQIKSAVSPASGKDGQLRVSVGSASELPSTTVKEEKSSSSSQSHNCSLSFLGKEDARSSTAGSMSVNKISTGGSRHRKFNNGLAGSAASGIHQESGSSRSLALNRNLGPEILPQSGLTSENAVNVPIMEGNGHKLIVKIPNRGRSPSQSVSGGTFEDPSIMNSRDSSPVLSDNHDQFDRNSKDNRNNITSDVNAESWQSNDFKDLTGSDEGDGSPAAFPDEEQSRTGEDIRKLAEVSKAASSSTGNGPKGGKLHEASFCSINALIESCVKDSETNETLSIGDDVGMNLLASVAAGEMSKSDIVSPSDSPQRINPTIEEPFIGNDAKLKLPPSGNLPLVESDLDDAVDCDTAKPDGVGSSSSKDNSQNSKHALGDTFMDGKPSSPLSEEKQTSDHNERVSSFGIDLQPNADSCVEASDRFDEIKGAAGLSASLGSAGEKALECGVDKQLHKEKAAAVGLSIEGTPDDKTIGSSSFLMGDKLNNMPYSIKEEKHALEISSACPLTEFEGANRNDIKKVNCAGQADQKSPVAVMNSDGFERIKEEKPHLSVSAKNLASEDDELKVGKVDDMDRSSHAKQAGRRGSEQVTDDPPGMGNQFSVGSGSTRTNQKSRYVEGDVEIQGDMEQHSGVVLHQKSPLVSSQETRSRGSKFTACDADEAEECTSTTVDDASLSAAGGPDVDAKLKFDLNEGLVVDDGRCGEPISLTSPGCSSTVQLINSLFFPVSSVSTSVPASVTVAAAAKGPFVPSEDLLRSTGELGWKGSAATSAFRPAEPRKIPEMPVGVTSHVLSGATERKYGHRLLDIDLNVPDERVLEDMASCDYLLQTSSKHNPLDICNATCDEVMVSAPVRGFGGLDLDLNVVDEANDMEQCSTSRRLEVPVLPVKLSFGGLSNHDIRRDFDLNNGPAFDDGSAETSFNPHGRGSMQSHTHVAALRMSNADAGSYSPWFPHGNNFPTFPVPSILPDDGGEQPYPLIPGGGPQRMLGPAAGTPLTADVYRGSVSSSPAVPFPSTPFQYPVFPFGTTFPLPSASFSGGTTYMDSSFSGRLGFPPGHSQLVGPAGIVSSHFPRPYVISLPDGNNNGSSENSRKWGRQGIDLNAGPGGLGVEAKEGALPLASRQLSVANLQALADERARMYQSASGGLKRMEPEGGWDSESFRYKQSSWQ